MLSKRYRLSAYFGATAIVKATLLMVNAREDRYGGEILKDQ